TLKIYWNESRTSLIACFTSLSMFKKGQIVTYHEGMFEIREVFDQGRIVLAGYPTRTPKDSQEELISAILPHIRPGSVAFDIGANTGEHALAYARAGARVIAFEANPRTYPELCLNM